MIRITGSQLVHEPVAMAVTIARALERAGREHH